MVKSEEREDAGLDSNKNHGSTETVVHVGLIGPEAYMDLGMGFDLYDDPASIDSEDTTPLALSGGERPFPTTIYDQAQCIKKRVRKNAW